MSYKFSPLEMLAEWFRLPSKRTLASKKALRAAPYAKPYDFTRDEATAFEDKQHKGAVRAPASATLLTPHKSNLPHPK